MQRTLFQEHGSKQEMEEALSVIVVIMVVLVIMWILLQSLDKETKEPEVKWTSACDNVEVAEVTQQMSSEGRILHTIYYHVTTKDYESITVDYILTLVADEEAANSCRIIDVLAFPEGAHSLEIFDQYHLPENWGPKSLEISIHSCV